MAKQAPRTFLRKLARWAVRGLVILFALVLGLVLLVIIAVNLPPGRDLVRTRVNGALAESFVGKLVIDHIGYVGFDRIGNVRVSVYDAHGKRVLGLYGVSARASWPGIVADAIRKRPLHITITPVGCEHIEVVLIDDGDGSPTLASAFAPREPKPADPNAQPVSIFLPQLEVRHIWAHGGLRALPVIDAEVADLALGLASEPSGLTLDLKHAQLTTRSLPAQVDPRGTLRARVSLPSAPKAPGEAADKPRIFADFEGSVSGAPAKLHAELDRDAVKAALDAPAVPASVLRQRAPSLTLEGPTALELRAQGTLPALSFQGRVENAALKLALRGDARLEDTKRANVTLEARGMNFNALMASLPASELSADMKASVVMNPDGALTGEYALDVPRGRLKGLATPPLSTAGTLAHSEQQQARVVGVLRAEDGGSSTRLEYELAMLSDQQQTASGRLAVSLNDPKLAKALLGLSARGKLDANAELDLQSQAVRARLGAEFSRIALPPQRVGNVKLDATASGTLQSPELTLALDAKDAVVSGQKLRSVSVTARGKPERVNVRAKVERESGERVELTSTISAGERVELERTALALSARQTKVDARIARASFSDGRVQVSGFELTGAGQASGSGSLQNGRFKSEFSLEDLDIPRLARLAGVEIPLKRGLVSGEGKLHGTLQRPRGTIRVDARELDVEEIRGGRMKLALALDEKTVNGSLETHLGASNLVAHIEDMDLPRANASRAELSNLRGAVSATGSVDFAHLGPTLRAMGVPIEQARGELQLAILAENPRDGASRPTLNLKLETRKLKLIEQRSTPPNIETQPTARAAQPRSVEDIDARLALMLDAKERNGHVNLELFDRKGPLATIEADSKLPELGARDLAASFQQQPLRVAVQLHSRKLEELPNSIRPKALRGVVQAQLSAEGTLMEPKLSATVAARQLKAFQEQKGVDCYADLKYDRQGGQLTASADSLRGRAADFESKWQGDLIAALSTPDPTKAGVLLDADLRLEKFPLGIVPQLSERQIRGPLSGKVELHGLGRDAQVRVKLDGSRLKVGLLPVPGLSVSATNENGAFTGGLDIKQSDGMLEAKVSTPMQWGSRLVPAVDPHAKAELRAKNFQIGALSPLLLRYVSSIEGRLNANFRAELADGAPKLEGGAELKEGAVQLPQIGQRLSNVSAKVAIRDGEVRLDSLQANGITGRLTADARARINGTNLEALKARVDIKKKEKFPVTLEGVELGDAWGHAELNYTHNEQKTEIRVDVPKFNLHMPEQAPASVQDLEPDEHVRIGFHREDGKFVAIPAQPLDESEKEPNEGPPSENIVKIHLGDSVWLERGTQAKVQLSGDLTMISGARTRVQGRIDLKGGELDVNGKPFEIESGTVSFDGADASNPTIIAVARWNAPDYVIYAEYAGTVEAGKLTLRSEPALTQQEIISFLLFGTPDGIGSDGGDSGNAAAAFGVAGGTLTKGFNRVMSDFTHLDVSARVDTSTGSARPELVVQVTPRLTTRVTRALGDPGPSESPDRTFLTLELRLQRSWALSTIIGDRGASTVDLVWRHRY